MTHYVGWGDVRRGCGHKHKTWAAALDCVKRDHVACASLGGGAYSDRDVYKIEPDGRRVIPEQAVAS